MNREIFVENGEYTIFPVSNEDRENYVELHRQLNGEKSLFLNPYCKDILWEQVLQGNDKVFSIFNCNGEYCGSIEIQNPESHMPEIGIDLLESKRNKGIAREVIRLLAKRFYEKNPVDYFLIRISSKNPHSKYVFEKMGVIPIGEEESTFKTFMKDFRDTVGSENADVLKDKLKKYFDEDDSEEEIVYRYKLVPELFL